MENSDGILKQINNSNNINYIEFKIDDILEALQFLYNRPIEPNKQFKLYLTEKQSKLYTFYLYVSNSLDFKWWNNYINYDKSKFYLSIVRKHSLYKLLVESKENNYEFTLYKGTKAFGFYNNVKSLNKDLEKLSKEADLEDLKRKEENDRRKEILRTSN